MRPLLVALLLLLPLAPSAAAQASTTATLTIDVQPDHTERMTLVFEGLKRLTRYNDICLPEGARESSVRDSVGDVPYDARDEDGRRVVSFVARDERVTIEMGRAAPASRDDPLFSANANFCVPGGAHVKVVVNVPEGHTLFFLSDGGVITSGRSGTTENDGPTHVFYSYEAPVEGSGLQAFDVAPFRIFASPRLAPQAQEAARLAVGPLDAALLEAGLAQPFDVIRVIYQAETPYTWEAGHYNGYGFVAVKESTLREEPSEGWPIQAVKVLVHESFHAASFPYGRGAVEDSVSWWLEGTAKHSERHVDAAMPNATTHCQKSAVEVKCWSFDDRIARQDLETGYSGSFTFDTRWEPSLEQTEDTRRFYYGYSEYVVGAWIARHGVEAYRAAWDEIEAGFARGEGCPCGEGWLEGILDDDTMFAPWTDVKAAEPARFETLVQPFVKDEAALQRELDARADPLSQIPGVGAAALLAIAAAAWARRR